MVTYVEGVVAYAVFAVVCAILCIVFAGAYMCGRICCCCVRGGFGEVEALLNSSPASGGATLGGSVAKATKYDLGYPHWSRWGVRTCMFIYVVLVMAFIATGHISGNQGLTQSMRVIATSPAGLVSTVRSVASPLRELVTSLAADGIAPLLTAANATIQGAVDIGAAAANAQCIVTGVSTGLPDPAVLLNFVASANTTLGTVRGACASLQGSMGAITSTLASTQPLTAQAGGNLTAMYAAIGPLNASVTAAAGSLAAMQVYIGAFQSQAYGLPSVSRDLGNFSAHMPSQAAANTTAAGLTSLVNLSLNDNGNAAGRAALLSELTAVSANISTMPNLTVTASNLLGLNAQIGYLRGNRTIDALVTQLGAINAAVATVTALPPALNASVVAIQAAINSINLAPITAALKTFNTTLVTGLPNVTVVAVELAKIDGIQGIIDCMAALIASVTEVNATVLQLPSAFSNIESLVASVNSTYESAHGMISGFSSSLGAITNFTNPSNLPNISYYLSLVGSTQAQINNPPVSFASVQSSLTSATASSNAVNITSLISGLRVMNASVWDSNVITPNTTIASLQQLQPLLRVLLSSIAASMSDLAQYSSNFYCAGTNTSCTGPGVGNGCGGNTCKSGMNVCNSSGVSACLQDSDCPGSTCRFHAAVHVAAIAALQGYSAVGPDAFVASTLPTAASVAAAAATVAGVPSVSGLSSSIASLQTQLNSVPINSSLAGLQTLAAALDPSALGLGGINGTINSILATVGSVDLTSVNAALLTFQSSIGSVQASISGTLSSVQAYSSAMANFFSVTLPATVQLLSRPSLAAQPSLSAVLLQVAAAAQNFVGFVGNFTNSSSLSLNLTATVSSYLSYTNALESPAAAAPGAIYWLTQLPVVNVNSVSAAEAAAGGDVFYAPSGARWSGSRYCLTDACIGSSITTLNTQPLTIKSDMFGGGGGGGPSFSVSASREQLFFFPFLLPLVVALLGCCGAAGMWGKRWQRWPACCSSFWVCCTLPWMFLLVGALLFPAVMVASDACRGGFNVGYNYLAGSQAAICALLPGSAFLPGQGCQVTVQGQSVVLDIPGVYGALLGSCGAFPNALPSVYAQLQTVAGVLPSTYVNSSINTLFGPSSSLPVTPLPPLLNIFTAFGANVGGSAARFVQALGSTLSCDALNRDIDALVSGVCCNLMTSLYWMVASWYLIAFSMCLCGFGASVLGYKRFANALWGAEYEERLKAAAAPSAPADADTAAALGDVLPHVSPQVVVVAPRAGAAASPSSPASSPPRATGIHGSINNFSPVLVPAQHQQQQQQQPTFGAAPPLVYQNSGFAHAIPPSHLTPAQQVQLAAHQRALSGSVPFAYPPAIAPGYGNSPARPSAGYVPTTDLDQQPIPAHLRSGSGRPSGAM